MTRALPARALVLVLACLALALSPATDAVTINKAERTIDLRSAQTTVVTVLQAVGGDQATASIDHHHGSALAPHIAHCTAAEAIDTDDGDIAPGTALPTTPTPAGLTVTLAKALAKGDSASLRIACVYTHTQEPHPHTITQYDVQTVVYRDSHYLPSPYRVRTQTTRVLLPSTAGVAVVEANSHLDPTDLQGDVLSYGPYSNIAANSHSAMLVHYESNVPYITVSDAVREFYISPWASTVAVEETYAIRHDGAKLKGSFSRYDMQRGYNAARFAVSELRAILPPYAQDLYYRDSIGNISTSHVFQTEENVVVDIQPRFLLFGGWGVDFYWGYHLPNENVLSQDPASGKYVLKAAVGVPLTGVTVDKSTIRVLLPEGASDIEVSSPADNVNVKDIQFSTTFLDCSGRQVAVLEVSNGVDENGSAEFEVKYHFSSTYRLREPAVIASFVLGIAAIVLLYSRMDFSLSRSSSSKTDKADPAFLAYIERFRSLAATRESTYKKLVAALQSDLERFSNMLSQSKGHLDSISKSIDDLVKEMSTANVRGSIASDVTRYQSAEKLRAAALSKWFEAAAKGSEKTANDRRAEFERADAAVSSLISCIL